MTDKKPLSENDRNEIINVLNGVSYLLDTRSYDRLGQVFSTDMHFENPGRLTADGLENVINAMQKISNPAISHHITNVIIAPDDDQTVRANSKALTMRSDKSIAAAEYTDILKRTDAGWRISSRMIRPLT
jgi:hypothetical protein